MLGFAWQLSGRIIRPDNFLLSGLSGIRPDSKIHYPVHPYSRNTAPNAQLHFVLMHFILQWNCRGLLTSITDLQVVLSQRRRLIACLQETKLLSESPCVIKGYSVLRKDLRSETVVHGGILIAVHHSLPTRPLTLRTGLQAVASCVQFGQTRFMSAQYICHLG